MSKINWCPPLSAGLVLMDEWDVLYIESARILTFPELNASLIWTFSPLKIKYSSCSVLINMARHHPQCLTSFHWKCRAEFACAHMQST